MRVKLSRNKIKKITFDFVKPSGVLLSTLISDGSQNPDTGALGRIGAAGGGLSFKNIKIPYMPDMTEMEIFTFDGPRMIRLQYGANSDYFSENYDRQNGIINIWLFDTNINPPTRTMYRVGFRNMNSGRYIDFDLMNFELDGDIRIARLDRSRFIDGDMYVSPADESLENNRENESSQPTQYLADSLINTILEPQTTDLTISPFMPCGKLYIDNIEQDVRQLISYGENVSVILRAITRGNKTIRIVAGDRPDSTITWERTVNITEPTQTITPDNFGYLVINGFLPGWILKIDNIVRTCMQADFHYAVSSLGQKRIEIERTDNRKYVFNYNVVAGRNVINIADYQPEDLPTVDLINEEQPQNNTNTNADRNTNQTDSNRDRNTNQTDSNRDRNTNQTDSNRDRNNTNSRDRSNINNTNPEGTNQNDTTQYGTVTISGLASGSVVILTQGTKRKELRPDSSGNVTDSRIETGTWNVKVTENGSPRNSMDRTIIVEQARVALIDYSRNNNTPEEVSRLVIYLNEGKSVVMRGPDGEVIRETPVRGSIELDGLTDGNWEITIMQGDRELEKRTVRIQKGQSVEIEIDSRQSDIATRRENGISQREDQDVAEKSSSNLVYWILGIGVVGGIGYYYRKEISKFIGLDKADTNANIKTNK